MCDFMFNIGFLSHHAAKLRVDSISLELKCRFTSVLNLGVVCLGHISDEWLSNVISSLESYASL